MTIKVAINGYGRIGRNVLRAHYEDGKKHDLAIVAINDLGPVETNAHLTRYDTTHRKFPGKVEVDGDHMVVNGDRIKVFAQRDPAHPSSIWRQQRSGTPAHDRDGLAQQDHAVGGDVEDPGVIAQDGMHDRFGGVVLVKQL